MKALPSLVGLVTFDAVARHLSFSMAARELHITQGAVSHRIRGLEEELGVSLLARTSRRVGLTDAGQVLLAATHDALSRLRRGLVEMETLRHGSRITVSCSPSFAIRWLVPGLGKLRAHIPELELHIAADDQIVDPGVGSIDVCIRFGPGGYRNVVAEQLTHEVVSPVCSPLYLERLDLRTPADLAHALLLHDDVLVEHEAHVGWSDWLEAAGVEHIDGAQGLHFSHSHMALDAASAGQGIALARLSLVRSDLLAGRLVRPFDLSIDSGLNYWLITARGDVASRVASFREWLVGALNATAGHTPLDPVPPPVSR